jgi:hypothetical protein
MILTKNTMEAIFFLNILFKKSFLFFWIRSELSENYFHSVVVKIILINYAKKKTYSWLGWCESTKWIINMILTTLIFTEVC